MNEIWILALSGFLFGWVAGFTLSAWRYRHIVRNLELELRHYWNRRDRSGFPVHVLPFVAPRSRN